MFDKKEYIRLMKNISRRVSNLENRGKITAATTRFREVFGYSNLYTTKGVDEKTLKSNLQTLCERCNLGKSNSYNGETQYSINSMNELINKEYFESEFGKNENDI